jgi:hypothetical protein
MQWLAMMAGHHRMATTLQITLMMCGAMLLSTEDS